MEQGKKPIDQTKSFSIDTHTNLNPINSLSSQHSARLLAIVRSQNPSSSEWDLILPITSTTSSHSTILNILARIHQAIRKQTTLDLQIHAIRQVLKFTYTQQTAKPDFKLEYEEWAAYMHISITDYLIDHQIITLAYESLEANLLSFKSEWVQAIFHLRLVLIFLEEEDLLLAERHLYYANSLSPENSVIRLECEISSARLYFHQGVL
ncbi:uncharacterized protein MELLADRAFT_90777 [Melampsora larici-populina 98AG31]|uniref:Uncharacterized protein n=1 Tax=Melampsora larici-populina (strain 98AG31 / pathotype 3-4-7) TaxID=747676 RepID=F4R7G3_MELLP|nr:uncharacterized protein MELLADRAFT_90777 [Melampsora larici-populina 98AG31]EGG11791.1 hypothetical protein MELLADRAFT_90777 [Melampsora larici-populina 98AG31]